MKKELEKNRLDMSDAGIEILGLKLIVIDYNFNNDEDNEGRIKLYGICSKEKDNNFDTYPTIVSYLINLNCNYWYRFSFNEALELYNYLIDNKTPNLEK